MAQGAYFLDERFPSPLTHPYFPKASCGLLAIRGPHFRRGRFGKRRIPNTVQARFDTGRTRVFRSRRAFCTPNIFRCKIYECETPFHRGSNFFEPARFLRTGDSRETGGRDSAARQSQRAQDSFTPVRAYFGHRSIRPPFYPPCTPSRRRTGREEADESVRKLRTKGGSPIAKAAAKKRPRFHFGRKIVTFAGKRGPSGPRQAKKTPLRREKSPTGPIRNPQTT